MSNSNKDYYFLRGGGEMGKLIRAKDWSQTSLGHPKDWPASLRTMVSVMLDNPFGMYIAWGKDFTQIYNDGYRPILGATKHPKALGISTKETFSEIWHIIDKMFDGVMNGVPIGFRDFMLPLDRNGFTEICYFDFAYSPIRTDDGQVGGVLVTVIETTDRKKTEDDLIESRDQLQFAIDSAQLGTFDYNPITNKFKANNRLKEWFGLPPNEQIELTDAINAMLAQDRERVAKAIQEALVYSSGGKYDVKYTIVNPLTKKETIVHAKGRSWFNDEKIAYRLNGTLEDVTKQVLAQQKIIQSEQIIRNMVREAPIGICVMDADTLVSEIVNERFVEIAGKPYEAIIGKFYWDTFAEARPYYEAALNKVRETGIPYNANEVEIELFRQGKKDLIHVTFVYAPLKNKEGKVIKIAVWVVDNTQQVVAREKVVQSETNLKLMIMQAPIAIAILRDSDYKVEIANKHALELWGRTEDQVLGKSVFTSMPELLSQGIKELLDDVWKTGNRFATSELPVQLLRNGKLETVYINFSYEPLYDIDGKINGIMPIGFDVTQQVISRHKVEESEKRYNMMLMQSPFAFLILKGENMVIQLANDTMKDVLGKGPDIEGKSLLEVVPELKSQAFPELLKNVYKTGIPFTANEMLAKLERNGKLDDVYFNYVYQPYQESDGTISGVVVIAYDVTAAVTANRQIEASEKRFRNLIAQAVHPILIFKGEDLRLEVANEALFKLWNVGSEVIGKPFLEILPEMKNQPFPELMLDVLHNGVTHIGNEHPSTYHYPGGEAYTVYFNFIYFPFRESDGHISGVLVQAYDVTEQVIARKKIEESAKQFTTLANSIQNLAWMANADGWIYWYNDRWFEYTGTTLKDMEGWGWQSVHDPKHLPSVLKKWNQSIKSGESFEMVFPLKGKDNIFRPFLTLVYPLRDENGKVMRWIGTNTDISVQKEAEEQFRQMAERMPQKVWTADAEGNKTYFNQVMLDYSGLSYDELKNWGWEKIIHPDDLEENRKQWKASIMTGKDLVVETRFKRNDGKYLWHLTRAIAIKDERGKIKMWIGSKTEIQDQWDEKEKLEKAVFSRTAELQKSNEALEENNLELERMNKELQSFAYISSHDLQEPLRKIQIFATQIAEKELKNLSASGVDKFNRMYKAANRMQTLIQDLLAYSRTTTQERNFEFVDLKKIIEEIKEDLKEEVLNKEAIIEVGEMCHVKVIPFQFRQLLFNLISNSLKFSGEKDSPHIKIASRISSGEKFNNRKLSSRVSYCHLTVSDNGIGFEQEYSEKIFDVFQRLHEREKFSGTGIGLAIVKKIVENHNGIISARGELNKGATFDIYIPVRH